MTTREKIEADYAREAKARNEAAVSTLRMLKAAVKYADIEKRQPLDEDGVLGVISREVKKMRDALESYRSAGREDLSAKAEAEITLLLGYLPEPLDDAALEKIVRDKVIETGAAGPKDMGRVMAEVMKEAKGRADGTKVSSMVKAILTDK